MKTLLLCTALLTLLSSNAISAPWSKTDLALQGVVLTTTSIDWLQTRELSSKPKEYYERNIFLGNNPSAAKINSYMGGIIIGHTVVAHYLPDVVTFLGGSAKSAALSRTIWQATWIGIETSTISWNYSIGVRVGFR